MLSDCCSLAWLFSVVTLGTASKPGSFVTLSLISFKHYLCACMSMYAYMLWHVCGGGLADWGVSSLTLLCESVWFEWARPPCVHIYVNTWSPVGGTVWEGWGGVALLEVFLVSLGVSFEITRPSQLSSCSCLWIRRDGSSLVVLTSGQYLTTEGSLLVGFAVWSFSSIPLNFITFSSSVRQGIPSPLTY